ncbi:M56 family metallopeptidase [Paenibacillus eucommiae]|uniref:Beta-lactamase regulating signal transducer with metallopeptidase domain n=1 Tax=Paenibacillus eucommiae TaxID=1355755 RepID=A0ABS4J336_9BACL|nr:M56 family metallopeptidase [Paenibacillus eucommiae]MBP1994213.1 beta-lactamase regulating signal transducer with metallopeptidase domain [Paenibacillus eucommiae]
MQGFLLTLLECSAAMSVIALAYMAALRLFSLRYAAKWLYYIWLVIVVGWVIPFRPRFDSAFLPVKIPAMPTIEPTGTSGFFLPTGVVHEASRDLSAVLWWAIASVWLAGMIVVLAFQAWRYWRFMKMVNRWSEDVTDCEIVGVFHALKAEMKIVRRVRIRICPGITTPMLIGFIRPAVLLPTTQFEPDELAFILRHELVHLKRNDLWYKALVLLATAIHWFNPIVYRMSKSIAAQCEIACDERVLEGASFQQRKHYGETIIGVVRNTAKYQTSLTTNFYGGQKGMKTRVFSIMNSRKKKAGFMILSIALIVTIGTGAAFAISSPKETAKEQIRAGTMANGEAGEAAPALEQSKANPVQAQASEGAPVEGGQIRTSDGKELSIWLAAGRSNNFGKMAWKKGEPITFSVQSEEIGELEIGIMSVSTDKVYSEIVTTGTGIVNITVPEDGDYRVYIKNNAIDIVHFQLKLNKKLEGPLV